MPRAYIEAHGQRPARSKFRPSDALDNTNDPSLLTAAARNRAAGASPYKVLHYMNFSDLGLTPELLRAVAEKGYAAPTPIQSRAIPAVLAGRDVLAGAQTGTGKTAAFVLPILQKLGNPSGRAPRALVLTPTRELAAQIAESARAYGRYVGIRTVVVFGGVGIHPQIEALRRGCDLLVATPGRLKDFLAEGCVSLSEVSFAVLDEADRMLDKGFEEDIKLILGSCPPREKRQTLMFTATWPTSVRGLAEGFMVNPVKVTIGNRTRAGGDENGAGNGTVELQANSRIEQKIEAVDPRAKEQRLLELLREAQKGSGKNDRILVFCLYKKEAIRVEQFLQKRGMRVASIHGDLRQDQRTRSLESFKAGTTTVLVATDVAARGLDIPEVKLVINVTVSCTHH